MDRFGDETTPLDVTLPIDALVTLSNMGSPPDIKDCFRFTLSEPSVVTVVTTPDTDTDDELDSVIDCLPPMDPAVTFRTQKSEFGSSVVSCSGPGYRCGGDWQQSARSSCENETHRLPAGTTIACVQAALPGRAVERIHFLLGAPVPLHSAHGGDDAPGPGQATPITLDTACPKTPESKCGFLAFSLDPPGDTDCFQITAPRDGHVSIGVEPEQPPAVARFWKGDRFAVPLNVEGDSDGMKVKAGEKVTACAVSRSTKETPKGMLRFMFNG